MMRFLSRLGNGDQKIPVKGTVEYESLLRIDSKTVPGVKFVIYRVSFGRRMELSKHVREITQKTEFLEAGNEAQEKIEASILTQQIDAMYLNWGLVSVEGLAIDGEEATPGQLIDRGPEELAQEIVGAIKRQCGLGETDRKN